MRRAARVGADAESWRPHWRDPLEHADRSRADGLGLAYALLCREAVKHPLSDPEQRLALDAALLKLLDEDRRPISELARILAPRRPEAERGAQAEAGAPHSTSATPQT